MVKILGAMRRKLAAGALAAAEGGPGADRGWRLSLARAARDMAQLPLEIAWLQMDRRGLAELLELPPERAMITILEGPAEGLGLLVLSPPVLAAMIEMQTMGRVSATAPASRRPTRTDAAMVAGLLDAALAGLEAELADEADLVWAGGFRYASFLEDARPLGLLLEDVSYRVLRAEVSLAQGAKTGEVILALPAEGRGKRPPPRAEASQAEAGPAFSAALSEQVMGSGAMLQALLARTSVPLSHVMGLKVGDVLALPRATVDQITLEGIDGRRLSVGKLGQNRGMRAVRLVPAPASVQVEAGAQLSVLGATGTG